MKLENGRMADELKKLKQRNVKSVEETASGKPKYEMGLSVNRTWQEMEALTFKSPKRTASQDIWSGHCEKF
jgi:hypothetical protein